MSPRGVGPSWDVVKGRRSAVDGCGRRRRLGRYLYPGCSARCSARSRFASSINGRRSASVSCFQATPSRFDISALCIFGCLVASRRRSPLDQTMNAFIGRFTLHASVELYDMLPGWRCRLYNSWLFEVVDRSLVQSVSSSNDELIAVECELNRRHTSSVCVFVEWRNMVATVKCYAILKYTHNARTAYRQKLYTMYVWTISKSKPKFL